MASTRATHERLTDDAAAASASNRSFGAVFTVLFAVIGLWPLLSGHAPRLWSLALAAGFAGFALFRPAALAPLNRIWMKFGQLLHAVVNPLLMAIVFFTTLVPIGLILRLAGKTPLPLRPDPEAKTYWIERDPAGPPPESMVNQF